MWLPGGSDALMGDGTGHDRGQGTHPGQLVGPQAQGILGQEHQIGLRTHRHHTEPSGVLRPTAAAIASHGSSGATGASEPSCSRAPPATMSANA